MMNRIKLLTKRWVSQ